MLVTELMLTVSFPFLLVGEEEVEEPGIRGGGQRRGSEAESQRRGVRLG